MYTEDNLDTLTGQMRRRVLAWLLPEILLLAGVALSLTLRSVWVTGGLTSLLGGVLLFSLQLSILPVRRYRAFVAQALHGRTTPGEAAFVSIGSQAEQHEGVRVYPVRMKAEDAREELRERAWFWDANLPLPPWQPGERILLRSWERIIVEWEKAE